MRGSAPKGVSGSGPEISFGEDEFDEASCGQLSIARTVDSKMTCRHGSSDDDSSTSASGSPGDTKG
eukprot:1461397-Pleurochrysis_carterae.AAC.1